MMQMYFLSVLLNSCAGFILFTDKNRMRTVFSNKTVNLLVGICSLVIGFLKLFIVVQPDIVFFGDLLPAIAGMAGGANILLDYYRENTSVEITLPDFFEKLFVNGRKYIGILCVAASVLHFLFPRLSVL